MLSFQCQFEVSHPKVMIAVYARECPCFYLDDTGLQVLQTQKEVNQIVDMPVM